MTINMNREHPQLPLATIWYTVTFFAGIYWGISFCSGAFGPMFALSLPPLLCIGTAIVAGGGNKRRIIFGALTLYVNFLFTFSIGYGLASAGIIRFHYDSKEQSPPPPISYPSDLNAATNSAKKK